MIDNYFTESFKILHNKFNDPKDILNVYERFMWDYHLKHRSNFNLNGSFQVYNKQQAETFYRYVRLNYMRNEV
jgi:hypothetical protein